MIQVMSDTIQDQSIGRCQRSLTIEMNHESTLRGKVRFRCSHFYLKWEVFRSQIKISIGAVIAHCGDVSGLMRWEEQGEGQVELTILCQFLLELVVVKFMLIIYLEQMQIELCQPSIDELRLISRKSF